MDQTLTNKKFIEQMDNVITKLGGTPINLNLDSDKEDDILSNDAFAAKMSELVNVMDSSESGGSSTNDFANITIINNFSEGLENIELEEIVGKIEFITYENPTQLTLDQEFYSHPNKLKLPLSGGILGISLTHALGVDTTRDEGIELSSTDMDISVSGEIEHIVNPPNSDLLLVSGDGTIEITWSTSQHI